MASERLFQERHLPGGLSITSNPSNTLEESRSLEDFFSADSPKARETFNSFLEAYNEAKSFAGITVGSLSRTDKDDDHYRILIPAYTPHLTPAQPVFGGNDETYGEGAKQSTQPTDDNLTNAVHTPPMTDITRDEFSSTLSAIEERMDKRVDRMEKAEERRADAYRREQEARDRMYTERFEAMHKRLEDRDIVIDSKLDAMNSSVLRMTHTVDGFEKRLDEKLNEVKSSNRSARWATLAIAAATVVGIWGVNSTIIGSVTGFFDAGQSSLERKQSTEKLVLDAKAQSEATYKLLLEMQSRDQPRSPPGEPNSK